MGHRVSVIGRGLLSELGGHVGAGEAMGKNLLYTVIGSGALGMGRGDVPKAQAREEDPAVDVHIFPFI